MALTLEQLRQLMASQARSGQDAYYDPALNQQLLAMRGATQSGGHIENGEFVSDPITGYRMTEGANNGDRTALNGRTYQNLDTSGNQTGSGTWQGLTPDGWKDDLSQIARGAAVMGMTALGGNFLQGGGFGGAGAAGGGGSAMGGGAMGGGSALTAAGSGGGLMSSLSGAGGALGGMGGLLGPAAAIGGALLGSRGSQNTTTQEHRMDPRLDGAVFGAGGIVPQSQSLLQQQMSPQAQQGWMNMQNTGQSLLSNPIAGNGFAQFAGRK